jgi:hypothetical protein
MPPSRSVASRLLHGCRRLSARATRSPALPALSPPAQACRGAALPPPWLGREPRSCIPGHPVVGCASGGCAQTVGVGAGGGRWREPCWRSAAVAWAMWLHTAGASGATCDPAPSRGVCSPMQTHTRAAVTSPARMQAAGAARGPRARPLRPHPAAPLLRAAQERAAG